MVAKFSAWLAGASLAALMAVPAHATLFTLTDNDSEVDIETQRVGTGNLNTAGIVNWVIDTGAPGGGIDIMFEEAFWYRTNLDTQEQSLHAEPITFELASDTNANPGNDVLNVTYERAGVFEADVRWSLQGGAGCCSDIAEQVTITNLGSTLLEFTLFEYTDLDIDDVVDGFARFEAPNRFVQADGNVRVQTAVVPNVDAWEISEFPDLKERLDDDEIDNLLNATTPSANADLVWAAQWNFTIPVDGSVTISKDKLASEVPVPASVALLGLGLIGLGVIRRRSA